MAFKLTKIIKESLLKTPLQVVRNLSHDDIASILKQANDKYYNKKTPLFPDNIYDLIKDYLEEQNPTHPVLRYVGAAVINDKRKEKLPYYMGSLNKIKDEDKNIDKFKVKYPGSYLVSDKLDGNSGLLYLNKGTLKLFTRGNGSVGQNISTILEYVQGIPKNISKHQGELAVRGEIIISKKSWGKIGHKGSNARNVVAGVLNAKKPVIEIAKVTEFIAYEMI